MSSVKRFKAPGLRLAPVFGILAALLLAPASAFAAAPNAPSNPDADNITATSARIQWTDNADDEEGFIVRAAFGDDAPAEFPIDQENPDPAPSIVFLDVPGFTPNMKVTFSVAAVNADGTSDFSPDHVFWTLALAPPAPVLASASATSLNVTVVPADDNPDYTEYALACTSTGQWVQADGSLGAAAVWRTAADWGTIEVTGLTTGTPYTFAVRARNGALVETVDGPTASRTPQPPPNAPSGLKVDFVSANALSLSWNDNSTDESGFNIYAGFGLDTPTIRVASLGMANMTSYAFPVPANAQLSFNVSAFNNNGESGRSNTVAIWTLAEVPSAPVVDGATNNSLNVAVGVRGENPEETEYAVQCDTTGEWVQADGTLGGTAVWQTADAWGTATVTGLAPETLYEFSVTARNGENTETLPGPAADGTTLAAIAVPDVVGETQAVAENDITTAGLAPVVVLQFSYTVAAGLVISTDPAAGVELYAGAPVTVYVSEGPNPDGRQVPNVVGKTQAEAEADLADVDLLANVVRAYDPVVPAGEVLSTDPAAGVWILAGDTVTVTVSDGPEPLKVLVPDVVGMAQAAAEADLVLAGLVPDVVTAYSETVATGEVISTDPAAGVEVYEGSTVTVVVSLGPDPRPAPPTNPNVTDLTESSVTLTWDDNSDNETGFNLYADPGADPPTTFIVEIAADSNSFPVTSLPSDLQFTFQISAVNDDGESDRTPPFTFRTLAATPLPPLVGGATLDSLTVSLNLTDGNQDSTEYAVRCVTNSEWVQADGTFGPAPLWQAREDWGSVVVAGLASDTEYAFAVTARNGDGIESAEGPEASATTLGLVVVPDVVGKAQADALADLDAAGLLYNVQFAYDGAVPAGEVIFTDPAAGASVPQGTNVAVVVSQGLAPVNVPNLVGQLKGTAVAVLEGLNLVPQIVGEYSQFIPVDQVTSTNPPAGSLVAQGSTVFVTVSLGPEPVIVPNVVGLEQAEAENILDNAGLSVGLAFENSLVVPEGVVIRTEPAAGTEVENGSLVTVVVSLGPAPVPVPEVVGETLQDAEALLLDAGLEADVSYAYSLTVPEGAVISANPAAGTEVLPGTVVALVVSLGPAPVVVPDVRGFTQANAVSAVEDLGLTAVLDFANSITVLAGRVISTDPEQGSVVPQGDTVTILVSLGPATVTVPPVVGETREDAEAAVLGVNLVPDVVLEYSDDIAAGLVISSDPAAGTEVFEGTVVTLTVSLGRSATVPPVVGETREAAEAAIADAGLVPDVALVFDDDIAAGLVIATDPAAGTVVPEGTTVTVTVSLGRRTQVPFVVGETREDAEAAIRGANLVPEVVLEYSLTVQEGVVLSADPVGGTEVGEGTTVTITVSRGPAPTTVPDVVGLTRENAVAELADAVLAVGEVTLEYSNEVPLGRVISQSPEAGVVVLSGSAVDLVVSRGPIPVPVPNVVGESLENAGAVLVGERLVVGTVTRVYSPTVPVDEVISQTPAAGTEVLPGTAVNLIVSRGPQPVPVPNVVGQTQAFAQSSIIDAALAVGGVTQEYSATVPTGRVISQEPAAGAEVLPGTAVDLVVSRGPQPVPVPNVVGLTQAAAQSAIADAGLAAGEVTLAYSATVAAGLVISQNPAAGAQVIPGTAVGITVSRGPQPVAVPNVAGLTQAAAQLAITNAGLAVGDVTLAYSATVPTGRVISQNPAAGAEALPGAAVALVISRGPQPPKVPNVAGLTQAAAQTAITGAGLSVGSVSQDYSATVPAGLVISQNPAAGIEVVPGALVDFVVSLGPQPVPVPELQGLTEAAAQAALAGAGLVQGAVTEDCSDGVAAGRVFGQEPAAGSLALPGAAVQIWVSFGPCTVVVPSVVGEPRADAVTALAGAGLVAGSITEIYNEVVPAGRVISQTPASGARVVPGSPVNLLISLGPEPVPVPDVVGITQANASAALVTARMVAGTVTMQCSAEIAAGRVISQTPAAGTLAVPGTAVALVVSSGPCQTVVPELTGLVLVQALNALTTADLVSGTVAEEFSETVPLGQVISQSPAAGVTVLAGSAVDIVVSKGPAPLTPDEAKELLGDLFDEADTNGDGRLSFAEAQAVLAALTLDVFAALDLNGDGSLDREELGLPDIDDGCFNCNNGCNKGGFTPERLKKRLGDLFLTGLALSVLALLGRSRLG